MITFIPYLGTVKNGLRSVRRLMDLRHMSRHYHFLIDAAREYAVFTLDDQGQIKMWSETAQNMFGFGWKEVAYKQLSILGFDSDDEIADFMIAIGHGRHENIAILHRQDGTWFWANLVICPIYSFRHRLKGFSCVVRDITDQLRAQEFLAQRESALQQAHKMEAVGRMAGGMAHDFNNLITGIMGLGEDIYENLPVGDPKREDISEIIRASGRSASLVRQLLMFSRREEACFQPIDLNDLFRPLSRMLRRLIGPLIELRMDLSSAPCPVFADPGQIEQVAVNLVVNARDAIAGAGVITLRTGSRSISTDAEKASVYFEVHDTGKGMDKATLHRIFEPFFTTKAKDKGTGLGLSMVQAIVKQNKGQIFVDSEAGVGSCFRVLLPLADAALPASSMSDKKRSVATAEKTILILDDEKIVRHSVGRMLEKAGYRVLPAESGEKAVEMARQFGSTIDLVLADVFLPNSNGFAAVRQLAEIHPHIRVLYMSGYSNKFIRGSFSLPDSISFLEKPFNSDSLLPRVSDALADESALARLHG